MSNLYVTDVYIWQEGANVDCKKEFDGEFLMGSNDAYPDRYSPKS